MDTRQLETLLAVVQYGGFAAAADAVNLTASAVSQQIAALESELQTDLFDRSRRPPVLTAKGSEMVRSARTILQIVTETKASVSGAKVRGTLAFGTLRTAANSYVPHTLAAIRSTFPDLTFRLRIGMSEQLMSEVASGQLDAALVADQVTVPSGLSWTEVLSEPLLILLPAGTKELSFRELVQTIPYIRYRIHVPLARQMTRNWPDWERNNASSSRSTPCPLLSDVWKQDWAFPSFRKSLCMEWKRLVWRPFPLARRQSIENSVWSAAQTQAEHLFLMH